MSQNMFSDINPLTKSGTQLATDLNNQKDSLLTCHSGSSRPSYAVAGTMWLDTSGGTTWILKQYDGVDDIVIGTIDTTNNTFIAAGGAFSTAEVSIKTDNYLLTATDRSKLMVMNSGTAKAFTFPDIVGNEVYLIKNIGAGTLTLTPDGSDTIEQATAVQNESYVLIGDATSNKWLVLSKVASVNTDETCKVSADDTTAGYLNGKLVAGEGIDFTEGSPGGNETLTIACELGSYTNKGVVSFSNSYFSVTAGVVDGFAADSVDFTHIDWGYGATQVPENKILQQTIYQTQAEVTTTQTKVVPNDDTIPQSDEGIQLMTTTFTPKKTTSTLIIEVIAQFSTTSSEGYCVLTLFKDSETDTRAVSGFYPRYTIMEGRSLIYTMTSGTTSAITFKVRGGIHAAGTISLNRRSGSTSIYGGKLTSIIKITEIAA